MEQNTFEIIKLIIGSAGLMGIIIVLITLIFKSGKIVQKIDSMEKKIDILDKKVSDVDVRLGRVEGYLMGPTIFKEKK